MATKPSKKKNTKKTKQKTTKASFWSAREQWLPAVILLVITFLLFSPSISNDFVNWDDDVNILENTNIQQLTGDNVKRIFSEDVIGGYNPLTILTFAIEKHFFDLDPSVFHFNNIWLHLLCTFFVYRIMLLLGLSQLGAALAALLFGIHPMRVESVTWITERKDVLFGVFYLSALFLYVRSVKEKKSIPHHWIIPLFILSLFSKIQAVSFPLSMLVVDYYFNKKLNLRLALQKAPYFFLSLCVGLLGIYILSAAETITDDQYYHTGHRILIGLYSLCIYLVKFVFPYQMVPLYPYPHPLPWMVYVSPVAVAALIFGLYKAFQKEYRAVVFAATFFFFNVVFVLQVLGAGQGYLADRFTYIPYIGLFFLVGYGYDYVAKNKASLKTYLPMIAGAYLLILGVTTYLQQKVWKNSESLWFHVMANFDDLQRPYGNLAHHYRESGNFEGAVKYYSEGIKRKESATIYNGRGKTYFDRANKNNPANPTPDLIKKALADYSRGIELDPELAEVRINRGAAYACVGQFEKALLDLDKGLIQDPKHASGFLNRSLIYSIRQEHAKAIQDQDRYLSLKPNSNPDMYFERGMSKKALSRYQEAVDDFTKAINMKPNQRLYYVERAKAYKGLGDVTRSNADADRAQQLK